MFARNTTVFQVVFFGDDTILNAPVEEWPMVHVLVAFFSKGFPLQKAVEYAALRKPHILNDLHIQQSVLQDRRKVYDLLEASGIDVPRHVYVSRDGYVSAATTTATTTMGDGSSSSNSDGNGNGSNNSSSNGVQVQEFDDHISVNGIIIHKPFVEKPVNAEDHNISIYYPTSTSYYRILLFLECNMQCWHATGYYRWQQQQDGAVFVGRWRRAAKRLTDIRTRTSRIHTRTRLAYCRLILTFTLARSFHAPLYALK